MSVLIWNHDFNQFIHAYREINYNNLVTSFDFSDNILSLSIVPTAHTVYTSCRAPRIYNILIYVYSPMMICNSTNG